MRKEEVESLQNIFIDDFKLIEEVSEQDSLGKFTVRIKPHTIES